MRHTRGILAASLFVIFCMPAAAQAGSDADTAVATLDRTGAVRGQAHVASKIASNFGALAGSEENALALVNALRTGEPAQLVYWNRDGAVATTAPTGTATTPTVATIDPPTGHMGWGNVKISLALAQDQLARLGITNPTAEQLQAALNGGDVSVRGADGTTTTTTLRGVLQMRADGMGWGQIAKAGGTKLGPVVSQVKMANTKVAAIAPARTTAATTTAAGGAKAMTVKTSGVTTAAGTTNSTAHGHGKGITTGAAAGSVKGEHGKKGVVTATGAASTQAPRGLTTAQGAASSSSARGLVTAQGAARPAHHGGGHAHGRGVVTASGGSVNAQVAHGKPATAGAGVLTGTGQAAGSVGTAHGHGGGNGKGPGGDKGNGRGKG